MKVFYFHGWDFAALLTSLHRMQCEQFSDTRSLLSTENIRILAHLTFFFFFFLLIKLFFFSSLLCRNIRFLLPVVRSPIEKHFLFVGYSRPCSHGAWHAGLVLLNQGSCTKRLRIYPVVFPPSTSVYGRITESIMLLFATMYMETIFMSRKWVGRREGSRLERL